TRVLSGRGLPIPQSQDPRLVSLVREDRRPDSVEADQTLVLPGAANLVASTSAAPETETRESLFWISPQGVRFGIDWDEATLSGAGYRRRRRRAGTLAVVAHLRRGTGRHPAGGIGRPGRRSRRLTCRSADTFVRNGFHRRSASGAGGRRRARWPAGAGTPKHPADDCHPGAAGRHHRDPGGDVRLRRAIAAVGLL
ncbi:type VII secretion protein EccB, partial [Mycolicibacterium insubricum]|nr:type VII secretion protein EccB [Mycolicibacterium insubricum]